MLLRLIAVLLALFVALSAHAECVDINADRITSLERIKHINESRAEEIIALRPWPSVGALTLIKGIGRARIGEILREGLACVGVRAPAGVRESVSGLASIIDADTLKINGHRVRLIGIDSPELDQFCSMDQVEWPCGESAATAVRSFVGANPVSCEVYGTDRYDRKLAVCFCQGVNLNAEIVRSGWALAWYPESGAVMGPSYEVEQAGAERSHRGIWRGSFVRPNEWRR